MLKKNAKIVMGTCNPTKENLKKVYFDPETGFYYAIDGYRLVRVEVTEMDTSLVEVFEDMHGAPNFANYFRRANEAQYTTVEIPYSAKQIDDWRKACNKKKDRLPFTFGIKGNSAFGRNWWVGINPKFLVDAMLTTGSQVIGIPDRGNMLVMEGNGYTWLIMPVECKDDYERNHTMTEIYEEVEA